jgi:hypothetical protein
MHSTMINGVLYGNLEGLTVKQNQRVWRHTAGTSGSFNTPRNIYIGFVRGSGEISRPLGV